MNAGMPMTAEELEALGVDALVDALVRAASDGNEFDNRAVTEALQEEVLRRVRAASELVTSHRVLTQARDENSTRIVELRSRVWELEAFIKSIPARLEELGSTRGSTICKFSGPRTLEYAGEQIMSWAESLEEGV